MEENPISSTVPLDVGKFLCDFHDHMAPTLDTYEQAIYLYIFRHGRLLGKEEIVIGFKSARARMAAGIGERGKPMSEGTAYLKMESLQAKGYIQVTGTTHRGRTIRLHLPQEISGLIKERMDVAEIDIEEMDFFEVLESRILLLKRENYKCFYTLRSLTNDNFIVEHVVSRPLGDNSYRNCVAASREANNRKGALSAEDFLRKLFRDGFLNDVEFQDRREALEKLQAGELKPNLG